MLSTTVTVLVFVSLAEGAPGQGLQAAQSCLTDLPSYMPISGGPVSGCNEVKIDEEIYDDQESVVRGTQTTERYPRVEFTSLNLSEEDLAIKHTGMCSKMCYCAKVNPSSKDLAA